MDVSKGIPPSSSPQKKRLKMTGICVVCGDKASSMNHYGSKVCFSCRAFFRRLTVKGKVPQRVNCNRINVTVGKCEINIKTRQLCSYCRHQKCCQHGMESTMVMSRNQIQEVRKKAQQKREERDARATKKRSKKFRGNEDLSTVDTSDLITLADESMTKNDVISGLFLEDNNQSSSELVTSVLELDPSSTLFEFPSISSTEIQNSPPPNWDEDQDSFIKLIESILD